MTTRELRTQRREAERKAKKIAYQQDRLAAAASAPNPELFDEFSAEEQTEMMALRARVHARTGHGPTGPSSPEGKIISSGNSLKHGLASGRLIIPGEDLEQFEALFQDLLTEHQPAGPTESLLVRQMAQSYWLMQRALRLQNEAFTESTRFISAAPSRPQPIPINHHGHSRHSRLLQSQARLRMSGHVARSASLRQVTKQKLLTKSGGHSCPKRRN